MVDCGESIYNLIPKVEEPKIKEKRFAISSNIILTLG